jgi:hypothetical protein
LINQNSHHATSSAIDPTLWSGRALKNDKTSCAAPLTFFTSINEMEAVRDAAQYGGRVVFVTGSAKVMFSDPAILGMASGADAQRTQPAPAARKGVHTTQAEESHGHHSETEDA